MKRLVMLIIWLRDTNHRLGLWSHLGVQDKIPLSKDVLGT